MQCMGMHEHVTCKTNCIIGKNPIQTIALTLINQAHNPRMRENVIIIIENAMHDYMITISQDLTQNF